MICGSDIVIGVLRWPKVGGILMVVAQITVFDLAEEHERIR